MAKKYKIFKYEANGQDSYGYKYKIIVTTFSKVEKTWLEAISFSKLDTQYLYTQYTDGNGNLLYEVYQSKDYYKNTNYVRLDYDSNGNISAMYTCDIDGNKRDKIFTYTVLQDTTDGRGDVWSKAYLIHDETNKIIKCSDVVKYFDENGICRAIYNNGQWNYFDENGNPEVLYNYFSPIRAILIVLGSIAGLVFLILPIILSLEKIFI